MQKIEVQTDGVNTIFMNFKYDIIFSQSAVATLNVKIFTLRVND